MCLAVPGRILSTSGEDLERAGRVSFGGIVKQVSLVYVPDAKVGDYVLVYVGFAIGVLDEAEAAQVFHHLEDIVESAKLQEPRG